MEMSRGIDMRCFSMACVFGVAIASLGCVTDNWSSPIFAPHRNNQSLKDSDSSFEETMRPKGFQSQLLGSDDRAKDIERRLGIE